jgi:hypothetical protein
MSQKGGMSQKGSPVVTKKQSPIDPNHLTAQQAAKLLSAAGKVQIPVEQIEQDIQDGAPTSADGTLNLVNYAAWLVRGMGRGS